MLINRGIYSITNKLNGKRYIGSARNIRTRWNGHKSCLRQQVQSKHHSPHLQRAWNKYGEENFVFEIICQVWDEDKLTKVEQIFLDIYQVYNPQFGYNTCEIAGSTLGFRHSEESKEKMSIAAKKKIVTVETRKKMSEARKGEKNCMFGKHLSEKTKRKLSESHKGLYEGEKNPMFGKHHSDETKQKIAEKATGRIGPNLGKHLSDETKKKIGEANKGKCRSEETKEKISKAQIGKHPSKETLKKMSEACRGEKSSTAKLTWEKVREIRKSHVLGEFNQRQLSEKYEISHQQISRIINNERWIEPKKEEL